MIMKVPYAEFDKTIAEGIWVVDFYTDHCGPCKMLDVTMNQVINDNPIVNLAKCNIEDDPEYAERFGVDGTPTVLFCNNGVEKSRFVGAWGRDKIEQSLSECMYD